VQIPDGTEDEAVRIFLEFDRLESAIKGSLLSQQYFVAFSCWKFASFRVFLC